MTQLTSQSHTHSTSGFVLGDASFQYAGVKIDGLSREKILDRLDSDLETSRARIDNVLNDVLSQFLESGIVSVASHESLKRGVDRANITDDEKRAKGELLR